MNTPRTKLTGFAFWLLAALALQVMPARADLGYLIYRLPPESAPWTLEQSLNPSIPHEYRDWISPYPWVFSELGLAAPSTGRVEFPQPFRTALATTQHTKALVMGGTLYFPESGTYQFYIQGAEDASLWLSPTARLEDCPPEPFCTAPAGDPDAWGESPTIVVRRGEARFFCLRQQSDAGQPAFFRLAWRINGGPVTPVPLALTQTGRMGGRPRNERISQHPRNLAVIEGDTAQFGVRFFKEHQASLGWRRNGQWIDGAAAPLLEFPARAEDHGATFQVIADDEHSLGARLYVLSPVRHGIRNLLLNERLELPGTVEDMVPRRYGSIGGSWITQGRVEVTRLDESTEARAVRLSGGAIPGEITQPSVEPLVAGIRYRLSFEARAAHSPEFSERLRVSLFSPFENVERSIPIESTTWEAHEIVFVSALTEPKLVRFHSRAETAVLLRNFVLEAADAPVWQLERDWNNRSASNNTTDNGWHLLHGVNENDRSQGTPMDQRRPDWPVDGVTSWTPTETTNGFFARNTRQFGATWQSHDLPAGSIVANPGAGPEGGVAARFEAPADGAYSVRAALLRLAGEHNGDGVHWYLDAGNRPVAGGLLAPGDPPVVTEWENLSLRRGDFVQLTLTAGPATAEGDATTINLTVHPVDVEPAPLSGTTPGVLRHDLYCQVSGSGLLQLINDERFPDRPDTTLWYPDFNPEISDCAQAGVRVTGYLVPSVSGPHRFEIRAEGEAALYLSSDSRPANRRLIAFATPSTAGTADSYPAQSLPNVSAPHYLLAGTRYSIELRHRPTPDAPRLTLLWETPETLTSPIPFQPITPDHLESLTP